MNYENEAKIIYGRIEMLFKRMPGHQYKIIVVNSPYNDEYTIFFDDIPLPKVKAYTRSTAIYEMPKNQDDLNKLIAEIKKLTNLTIIYRNVEG